MNNIDQNRFSTINVSSQPQPKTSLSSVHSPRSSEISLLNQTFQNRLAQRSEDRHWSWGYLRKRFLIGKLENLYNRYIQRIQIAYFHSYLLVQAILSFLLIIILVYCNYNSDNGNFNTKESVPEITRQITILTMSVLLFYLVWDEEKFHKYPFINILISVFVVSIIHLSDIAVTLYFYVREDERPVRTLWTFQLLIVIYFFLPIPRKAQAIILGALVSTTDLLCSIILHILNENGGSDWIHLIIFDAIYYLCGNVIGIYTQFLTEVSVRRAFLDRRRCIKSTIKKTFEKEQQEHLLQSMLPKRISEKVKLELLAAIQLSKLRQMSCTDTGIINKPFRELFVERHNNVSILFADIVNFTQLTGKLDAEELVACLNSLFASFDSAAKEHDCLRIKLLGDCYYCTSTNAKNCVEFGHKIIEIIKTVKYKYQVDVSMRIGIHTGNILSGLIGIYKWQYDIWSKDVTIANLMEKNGQPGLIHVSKVTKDCLGDSYDFKTSDGMEKDSYLKENNIETYFITSSEEIRERKESNTSKNNSSYIRRRSSVVGGFKGTSSPVDDFNGSSDLMDNPKRRSNLVGVDLELNIINFLQMLTQVNEYMSKAIDEMPFSRAIRCCSNKGRKPNAMHENPNSQMTYENINPIFMNFERISLEAEFQRQHDPLFKFYVSCSLFVLICQGIIMLLSKETHATIWIAYGSGLFFNSILLLCLWTPFLWDRFKDPHRDSDMIPHPRSVFVRIPYKFSIFLTKSWIVRAVLYFLIVLFISALAIIDVRTCETDRQRFGQIDECTNPWFFTCSCAMSLLVTFAFFRIHFLLKLTLSIVSLVFYGHTMMYSRASVFENQKETLPGFTDENSVVYSHLVYLCTIVALLHIMDRQVEYINRLNFAWKLKLNEENEEASTTQEINAILIYNILPLEIANIYLDSSRAGEGYSRKYHNVSVCFASIPNFMDSFADNDIAGHGFFLQILNEIIVEFDQALLDQVDIEKIKVVGSTYMVACGLEVQGTGRLSTLSGLHASQGDTNFNGGINEQKLPNEIKRRKTLVAMVKFAASMMSRLDDINKDAFQNFQLRVGIDCGPVVAGVIGAEKPMYDIWGDTVNLSSRMDTTGVPGKIQVSEESAKQLMEAGVQCECRGEVNVKGKGVLTTYFVSLQKNYDMVDT